MTIQQSVINSVLSLENAVQNRWIKRALILCSDENQCIGAGRILTSMDHMVEVILSEHVTCDHNTYHTSIHRLRNGLSKVLVTTADILSYIQKVEEEPLYFDIIL